MAVAKRILAPLVMLAAISPQVHADDACTVVLCLSFSKWDEISQCVPPVRKALRDAALGKPPKKCKMGSADSSSTGGEMQADSLPANRDTCPAGHWLGKRCEYDGVIRVSTDGQTWTNTWWNKAGDTASQTCPAAPSAVQEDPVALDTLLTRTRELNGYAAAAAEAGALSTYVPSEECADGDSCAPLGQSRPPLPADQNCTSASLPVEAPATGPTEPPGHAVFQP